jgi:RNase P subunit RPR2
MNDKKNRSLTDTEKELKDKASKLRDDISKQTSELAQVQEKCTHPEEKLKFVPTANGSSSLRVTCEVCNKVLRYPSDNDLEKNGYK